MKFVALYLALGAVLGIRHLRSGLQGSIGATPTFLFILFAWPVFLAMKKTVGR